MTGDAVPSNPSVLNTTVLSNFAYVDQLWVVAGLSGICTVPIVREELENGVDDHPYLRSALDALDDQIPVATVSDAVANREAIVSDHLDSGEALYSNECDIIVLRIDEVPESYDRNLTTIA